NSPHSAYVGVNGNNNGTCDDALPDLHAGDHVQNQRHCNELACDVSRIGRSEKNACDEFGAFPEAHLEVVAKRKQLQLIQFTGEEVAKEEQTERGTKRVFDNCIKSAFQKL